MRNFAIYVFVALILVSCGTFNGKPTKVQSTGSAYEVIVLTPRNVWNSSAGDTLRAVLLDPVGMLNQREPQMDIVNMNPEAASEIMLRHRNIIRLRVDPTCTEASMLAQYDTYSAPQLVVEICGPNDSTVTNYIWDNRVKLLDAFLEAERVRYSTWAERFTEKEINKKIEETFGFKMAVPKGYSVRNATSDFIWISNELPLVSQGLIIYSYPYTGKTDFEADSLVNRRNEFVANVPGPVDGSYMKSADIEPEVNYIRVNGRFWAEMRGFWDVQGDFMGGPFVSYSTLDTETQRVICIDGYLFSPAIHKRNYIRQIESLLYTVKFKDLIPTEETKAEK